MRLKPWILLLLSTLPLGGTAYAAGVDLHALWDDRCMQCHGHSADFARRHLQVGGDGTLRGSHADRDLRLFLANHHLPESEVDAVYDMLKAQAVTPPRFREECAGCHGPASELARESLGVDGDVVRLSGSGETLRAFMGRHRGLSEADADFFTDVLSRVAREVHRP